MSYCKEEGKDRIIFATKEDHDERSKAAYLLEEDDDDDEPGLINEDGSINWNCPCLGGMATGPCGPEFREAFSCFHYSTEEPKGSDCFEAFKAMQDCMGQYPFLYPRRDEDGDDEGTEDILELDAEKDSGKNSESKNIEKSGSEGGEADESHEKSSSKSSDQGKS